MSAPRTYDSPSSQLSLNRTIRSASPTFFALALACLIAPAASSQTFASQTAASQTLAIQTPAFQPPAIQTPGLHRSPAPPRQPASALLPLASPLTEAASSPAPTPAPRTASQPSIVEASLSLPDSPGALSPSVLSSGPIDSDAISSSLAPEASVPAAPLGLEPGASFAFQNFPADNGPVAGPYDKYIKPGQQAPRLSVRNKVGLGIKDTISPLSVVGWLAAAGYAQAVDNSPNYDSPNNDRSGKAFAQRLGAAAARASSEGIFSDSIMSSVFHQDPRYYKLGPSHSLVRRTAYAATRPLITRTDGGHTTVNLSYITGNLAGAFLTQAYYPPVNRGVSQVMQTFGGSIGGGALGFLSSEFLDGLLQTLHLERRR